MSDCSEWYQCDFSRSCKCYYSGWPGSLTKLITCISSFEHSSDDAQSWNWLILISSTQVLITSDSKLLLLLMMHVIHSSMALPPLWHGAGGIVLSGLSICEWLSLCVPWTPCLRKQWRKFHPILVTDVFRFIDVPIRFFGQRSKFKVAAGNNSENRVNAISS